MSKKSRTRGDSVSQADLSEHSGINRLSRSKSMGAKTKKDLNDHSLGSKFKTLFKNGAVHESVPSTVTESEQEEPLNSSGNGNSTTFLSSPNAASNAAPRSSSKSSSASASTKTSPQMSPMDSSHTKKFQEVGKRVGNLVVYSKSHEHEHHVRVAKVQSKTNYIPGVALLSSFLKVKPTPEEEVKFDSTRSIFFEASEFKMLHDLRRLQMEQNFDKVSKFSERSLEKYAAKVNNKRRSDAVSTVESIEDEDSEPAVTDAAIGKEQVELINRLTEMINCKHLPETNGHTASSDDGKLTTEYGVSQGICGRGTFGVVKIVSKIDPQTKVEKFYAVKELKKRPNEDMKVFSKRLISEFIISLSLNHPNIIRTYDLMRNSKGVFSEVLEYCDAGDLFALVQETGGQGLHYIEADCFFKQILYGLIYMHSKGIAHCDLKPENILLTKNGTCKIIDFGTSVVFKTAWENSIQLSSGPCGSEPYVAPEEFSREEYDPRIADIWSIGVVYMVMRVGTYLWQCAKSEEDDLYERYLDERPKEDAEGYLSTGSFELIETLTGGDRHVEESRKECIYDVLDPDPDSRMSSLELWVSKWVGSIKGCRRKK